MTWYVATLIQAIILDDNDEFLKQEKIPIFESHFLVEAQSFEDADKKACEIGVFEQNNGAVFYNDKPAHHKFLGVRKIHTPFNAFGVDDDAPPSHGTELTHSYFEVSNIIEAEKLAKGEQVIIDYIDNANDEI